MEKCATSIVTAKSIGDDYARWFKYTFAMRAAFHDTQTDVAAAVAAAIAVCRGRAVAATATTAAASVQSEARECARAAADAS